MRLTIQIALMSISLGNLLQSDEAAAEKALSPSVSFFSVTHLV